MSHTDHHGTDRHHPGHSQMKRGSARAMRRLTRDALRKMSEPAVKMPSLKAPGFCCGHHLSDWRY